MNRMITFAVLFSCCALSASCDDVVVELPAKEDFHLYLLIGQSNMAGRGKVADQDRKPHPRVLTFTKEQKWTPAIDPIHFDKPKMVGVGIGKTFGEEMANDCPAITVGLIPCAVGGSPIEAWEPGGFHEQTKSHPWDDMLERTRAALKVGTLKGILWHQGESDASPERAEKYEKRLHNLIALLRKELDANDVPFIAGHMGQFKSKPWNESKKQIDAVHQQLPEKITNTAFVSSNGFKHKGDETHFDATSLREFGKRYAAIYRNLDPESPSR